MTTAPCRAGWPREPGAACVRAGGRDTKGVAVERAPLTTCRADTGPLPHDSKPGSPGGGQGTPVPVPLPGRGSRPAGPVARDAERLRARTPPAFRPCPARSDHRGARSRRRILPGDAQHAVTVGELEVSEPGRCADCPPPRPGTQPASATSLRYSSWADRRAVRWTCTSTRYSFRASYPSVRVHLFLLTGVRWHPEDQHQRVSSCAFRAGEGQFMDDQPRLVRGQGLHQLVVGKW